MLELFFLQLGNLDRAVKFPGEETADQRDSGCLLFFEGLKVCLKVDLFALQLQFAPYMIPVS